MNLNFQHYESCELKLPAVKWPTESIFIISGIDELPGSLNVVSFDATNGTALVNANTHVS